MSNRLLRRAGVDPHVLGQSLRAWVDELPAEGPTELIHRRSGVACVDTARIPGGPSRIGERIDAVDENRG